MRKLIVLAFTLLTATGWGQVNMDSLWAVWNDDGQQDSSRLRAIGKIAFDLMREENALSSKVLVIILIKEVIVLYKTFEFVVTTRLR